MHFTPKKIRGIRHYYFQNIILISFLKGKYKYVHDIYIYNFQFVEQTFFNFKLNKNILICFQNFPSEKDEN